MGTWPSHPSFVNQLPLTRRAVLFAERAHRDQLRDTDHAPFVLHPLEVAALLADVGLPDEVVAAGVLHDVVERTDIKVEELAESFGTRPAALVAAVSEDPAIADVAERKRALREQVANAPPEAAAVFAADKIARVRDLRVRMTTNGSDGDVVAKLDHYVKSLEMLERLLPDSQLVRRLRFELEALHALPPGHNGRPA